MDIDRYISSNEATWARLDELTRRARQRVATLEDGELDELVALYQRSAAQLSYAQTYFRDPALTARLTKLVAAAAQVIYGKRPRTAQAVVRFFATTFPAAVWHNRRFMAVAAVAFFGPAVLVAVWLLNSRAALDASGSAAERTDYVEQRFEQYYSEQPSAQFFTAVTTNNIRVGFMAFALGGIACIPGVAILAFNGVSLGQAAAWMISEGDTLRFFGLILPHGALELTGIVLAGGAGLAVGWALIAPGDRLRSEAVAEEGRRAAAIVLGLVATFVAAGLIEGFVTGSGLPAAVRVGIGLTAWAVFVTYLWRRGRAAVAQGLTGALGERPAGVAGALPVAASSR
ncbi:stage II sporulation protein M [Rhabdothermincola sediminis]|uniref:stage II sporulation protein M n=1 Tax=Rhabdothermincola sediminis TaxID=2751370 RepID=UPI001AA03070|nr:stage II sporulation protein M [Rhabdothermincola sediminis]